MRTAVSISTPLIPFAYFRLKSFQVTDTQRTYEFSDHLGLRVLITAALALLTIKTIS